MRLGRSEMLLASLGIQRTVHREVKGEAEACEFSNASHEQ